jgi:hypothetical protein
MFSQSQKYPHRESNAYAAMGLWVWFITQHLMPFTQDQPSRAPAHSSSSSSRQQQEQQDYTQQMHWCMFRDGTCTWQSKHMCRP